MSVRATVCRLLLIALVAVTVPACGGGSSGGPADAETPPPVTGGVSITGTVSKGPLDSSIVSFQPIDAFGDMTGVPDPDTATTDANGRFVVNGPFAEARLISTSSGTYVDEADREPVPALKRRIMLGAGEGLESLLPAGTTSVTVSIATQALLGKSRRETRGGTFLQQFAANRELAIAAFGFDIVTTQPANPVSPDQAASMQQRQYAMVLGGLANLVNRVTLDVGQAVPSIETIQAVADDFSDGRIDGMVDGAPVIVGGAGLPIGTFSLNEEIARFRNNNFDAYASTPLITVDEAVLSQIGVPINATPAGVTDDYTLARGETLVITAPGVLGNDTDADNNPLTAELVPGSGPANAAQFILSPDGSFSYSHDGSGPTIDSFSYVASDGLSASAPVVVTLNVLNARPLADDDVATVAEGGLLVAPSVLLNDSDADMDALTAVLADPPVNGQLLLNTDGTFEYLHDGSETVSDQFTYVANDGFQDSLPATVTITITPVNDAPVANPDSITVDEGGTISALDGGAITVLANDTDAEMSALTAIVDTQPVNGQLMFSADGTFSYTHNGGETTSDSFTYFASDGMAMSAPATVTITINPVNDPPDTTEDSLTVDEGGTATTLDGGALTVLDNDTDAEFDTLTAIVVDMPANGLLMLNPDGTFDYTHDDSETVSDQFTYVANDGTDDSVPTSVSITINPVNDPPMAMDDSAMVDRGGSVDILDSGETSVLANDTDAENDPLTAQLIDPPSVGQVFFGPDGSFDYVHDGSPGNSVTFTYVANDGTDDSIPATVTININNLVPLAVDDGGIGFETNQDTAFLTANVLSNDDIGDPPTRVTDFDNPSTGGGTVVQVDDGVFSYTPPPGITGTDTFDYTITDNDGESSTATVTITINAAGNQAPTALDLDSASVDEGQPVGTVVGTFSTTDPDIMDVHLYSLVAGTGDTDNASFTILDGQLRTATIFDAMQTPSLSIRVETDDQNGGRFEQAFTITVNDLPNPRTWINPQDGDWSDPANWSPFGAPEPNDAVVIDIVGAAPTITISSVDAEVYSVVCSNTLVIQTLSSLTVHGPSDFSGTTILEPDSALVVDGPDADVGLSGAINIADGDLTVLAGGALTVFFGAMNPSYLTESMRQWSVDGQGSRLAFPDLQTVDIGLPTADQGSRLVISATNGAVVDLPVLDAILVADGTSLSQLPGLIDIRCLDAGARVQMPQLRTLVDLDSDGGDAAGLSALLALGDCVIEAPLLTDPEQVNIQLGGTGLVDVAQLVSLTDGILSMADGNFSFPNLVDLTGSTVILQAGATVDLSAVTGFDDASAEARGGAVLSLPGVTSYLLNERPGFAPNADWIVDLSGSLLEFPNLTDIQVGLPGDDTGPRLQIDAVRGGQLDLPLLSTIAVMDGDSLFARRSDIELRAEGAGSLIQMPVLTSFVDNDSAGFEDGTSMLTALGGGQIAIPSLTDPQQVSFTIDGVSLIDIAQLNSIRDGVVRLDDGNHDFPNLVDLTGSIVRVGIGGLASVNLSNVGEFSHGGVEAYNGSVVMLPGVTNYLLDDLILSFDKQAFWIADGAGSRVEFSGLVSVQVGLPAADTGPNLRIQALNGGVVDLPAATGFTVQDSDSLNRRRSDIDVLATGPGSAVQIPMLTTFVDTDPAGLRDGTSALAALDSGSIIVPSLDTTDQVSITIDGQSSFTINQLNAMTNGVLTLSGAGFKLPNLVDLTGSVIVASDGANAELSGVLTFDGGGAEAYDGSTISMPVTSYLLETNLFGNEALWLAEGAGSQLFISDLSQIQIGLPDSMTAAHLDIVAVNGGNVFATQVFNLTVNDSGSPDTRDIDVTADGAGSAVELTQLMMFFDLDLGTPSTITQINAGIVTLSPMLATQNVIFLP